MESSCVSGEFDRIQRLSAADENGATPRPARPKNESDVFSLDQQIRPRVATPLTRLRRRHFLERSLRPRPADHPLLPSCPRTHQREYRLVDLIKLPAGAGIESRHGFLQRRQLASELGVRTQNFA
jgi:hypothetical protein